MDRGLGREGRMVERYWDREGRKDGGWKGVREGRKDGRMVEW